MKVDWRIDSGEAASSAGVLAATEHMVRNRNVPKGARKKRSAAAGAFSLASLLLIAAAVAQLIGDPIDPSPALILLGWSSILVLLGVFTVVFTTNVQV